MNKVVLALLILILSGCASTSRVEILESKVKQMSIDQDCQTAISIETSLFLRLATGQIEDKEEALQVQMALLTAGQARAILCTLAAESHKVEVEKPTVRQPKEPREPRIKEII